MELLNKLLKFIYFSWFDAPKIKNSFENHFLILTGVAI
jgi:hypothetical protein